MIDQGFGQTQVRIVPMSEFVCKSMREKYTLGKQIGHGAYGAVYQSFEKQTGKKFALKKMENFYQKEDKEGKPFGFPITTLREIKLLQHINHQNILNINEVVFERPHRHSKKPPTVYLCLDLMQVDLAYLVKNNQYVFTPYRIQQITKQILLGLQYLHSKGIAHRDLKPSNILMGFSGSVKIADFGLAKKLSKFSTPLVVTMWYRAPELLLNIKTYKANIDIWSVGCMIVEFLISKPLFYECQNQTSLIKKIFQLMGTPDAHEWQGGIKALEQENFQNIRPDFTKQSEIVYRVKKLAPEYEDDNLLLDLIEKMLRLDPASRYSASQCLGHDFFKQNYAQQQILTQSIVAKKQKAEEGQDQPYKKIKF